MPSIPKVLQLPEGIRRELHRRLVAASFAGFEDHAAWLASKGFTVGKSALFDHAKKHREAILAEVKLEVAELAAHASTVSAQRIECLKVAADVRLGGVDLDEVVRAAEKLLTWASR